MLFFVGRFRTYSVCNNTVNTVAGAALDFHQLPSLTAI